MNLPPTLPRLGEHPENATALVPVDDLRQAYERGQISREFAVQYCPSRHLVYVLSSEQA